MRTNMKKNQLWAGLLSTIDAGLGQIYNGKVIQGLLIYFVFQTLIILFYLSGILSQFFSFALGLLFLILLRISIVFHAASQAREPNINKPKLLGRWYIYIGFIVVSLIFTTSVFIFLEPVVAFQTAYVPTANMLPTIQTGDYLIIKIDRRQEPIERLDLVIYNPPDDPSARYIGRIIGLPGDTLYFMNNIVYINGNRLIENYVYYNSGINNTDELDSLVVPRNNYFLMGDNRGDSRDSRYFGVVVRSNIFGKPLYIYWSNNLNRVGNLLK